MKLGFLPRFYSSPNMVINSVTGNGVLLGIFFLKIVTNGFVEDVFNTVKDIYIFLWNYFFQDKVIDDDFESAGLHVGINVQYIYISSLKILLIFPQIAVCEIILFCHCQKKQEWDIIKRKLIKDTKI